jgi:hypothetical protein
VVMALVGRMLTVCSHKRQEPNTRLAPPLIPGGMPRVHRPRVQGALAGSARHAEVCIHISERRSRLLGLDKPARVDTNVLGIVAVDQIDAEIERLLEEYWGHAGP